MSSPMKVVIVGGVAAGPKVVSRIIRLKPDAEVTILEKGRFLSYAGCGLPYTVTDQVLRKMARTFPGKSIYPVFSRVKRTFRCRRQHAI